MRAILVPFLLFTCCAIFIEAHGHKSVLDRVLTHCQNLISSITGKGSTTPPELLKFDDEVAMDEQEPHYEEPFIGDIGICRDQTEPYPNSKGKLGKVEGWFRWKKQGIVIDDDSDDEEYRKDKREEYTNPGSLNQDWSDPDETKEEMKHFYLFDKPKDSSKPRIEFNAIDTSLGVTVDRRSRYLEYHNQEVQYEAIGEGEKKIRRPLFPLKHGSKLVRLGMGGRGGLGRLGCNRASDAILSRTVNGELEFLAIQRKSNEKWGMPGGFLDAKPVKQQRETSWKAAIRELHEEALIGIAQRDSWNIYHEKIAAGEQKFVKLEKQLKALNSLFNCSAKLVFRGIVADSRNTETSYIETSAFNFHDDKGNITKNILARAGDDAKDARWINVKDLVTEEQATTDPIKSQVAAGTKFIVWNTHLPVIREFAKMHHVEIFKGV